MLSIIYEDKDILALNKPAGIVVHPDKFHPPAGESVSLIEEVLEKYPEIKSVGDLSTNSVQGINRPGVVHRLDKETSGIILIAKNQNAFEYLKKQFQERKIEKHYKVLVMGNVKDDEGVIDLPIGRSSANPTLRVAKGKMRGKIREARTEYKVLKRFAPPAGGYTLLEAVPKTGRTHQIRAHFKALGHPVVCDRLYSGKRFVCPAGLERHFLHASSIELTLPSGSRTRLEAGLPKDLERVLNFLKWT